MITEFVVSAVGRHAMHSVCATMFTSVFCHYSHWQRLVPAIAGAAVLLAARCTFALSCCEQLQLGCFGLSCLFGFASLGTPSLQEFGAGSVNLSKVRLND